MDMTKTLFIASLYSFALLVGSTSAETIFADDDANGGNNGSSWTDAYTDLQIAVNAADYGDTVRVAAGLYGAITIKNGVSIIGAGTGRSTIDAQSLEPAVLCKDCDDNTLLEGFSIINGLGENSNGHQFGGGMDIFDASPTIANCEFRNNQAEMGGAIACDNAKPTITNCTFTANRGQIFGGAVYCTKGKTSFMECTFQDNSAGSSGGAILIDLDTDASLDDCIFKANETNVGGGAVFVQNDLKVNSCVFDNNTADIGGAIRQGGPGILEVLDSEFTRNRTTVEGGAIATSQNQAHDACHIVDSRFTENSAPSGGAILLTSEDSRIFNCLFERNSANVGAGIIAAATDLSLANCIFNSNTALYAGGSLYCPGPFSVTIIGCTFHNNTAPEQKSGAIFAGSVDINIASCIFWPNASQLDADEIFILPDTTCNVSFSDIRGGYQGFGNIDADPLFADPQNDDFTLSTGSPCIDAGSNLLPDDSLDLDGDGDTSEKLPIDINGDPGFMQVPAVADTGWSAGTGLPIADMGACEAPGVLPIAGDINIDGQVNMKDLAILAEHWLEGTEQQD